MIYVTYTHEENQLQDQTNFWLQKEMQKAVAQRWPFQLESQHSTVHMG